MTGRRAIVGLSLLCALAFSAFGAASASAKGTTAFTCAPVPKGDETTKGFTDEHCTKPAAKGTEVTFEHVAIEPNVTTAVTVTNEKTAEETKKSTPWVLSGEAGGAKLEIECAVVTGSGWIENVTTLGVMENIDTVELKFSTCKALKVKNCTVAEPIIAKVKSNTESAGEEMWVDFTEDEGGQFAGITFSGASCVLNGQTISVTGTVKGTTNGATLNVNTGENKLKFGPNAADLMGSATIRMTGGNPITFTTTEP